MNRSRGPRRVFPCERARFFPRDQFFPRTHISSWNRWRRTLRSCRFHLETKQQDTLQQAVSSARTATLRNQMDLAKGTMWTFLFDTKTCLSGATASDNFYSLFYQTLTFFSRQLSIEGSEKSHLSFVTA